MLKGIDVTLYEKTKIGEDGFHDPIYEENPVTVHNVLVGQPAAEEVATELQLTGRHIAYTLAIPGRHAQLERCAGILLRAPVPHLRRGRAGDRSHGPTALEQESTGGAV